MIDNVASLYGVGNWLTKFSQDHHYAPLPLAIGGGIGENSSQHIGFGRRLMKKAEDIAKKNGYNKIVDISGVGVRNYYREKLGYRLVGTYMVKNI